MNHENLDPASEANVDVCIVGGGPIGIELAVALGQQAVETQIIEAGAVGHTISWWAPGTRWFSSNERISIGGVPLVTPDQTKATREQYLAYLRSVVTQFDVQVRCFERVSSIQHDQKGGFLVNSGVANPTAAQLASRVTRCQRVVLAIGGTDFPRRLEVPGQDLPHVDGFLREPHRYFGRRVMIVGGRNSAVEAALRLHHAGAKVTLCYRGNELPTDGIKYWLAPEINGLVRSGRVKALFSSDVVEINDRWVMVKNQLDSTIQAIEVDDVLTLIGYEQDKTLLTDAGVKMVDETARPWYDEATMQTSVPGIYVAGTAVAGTQTSKYRTFLENCHEHVEKIVSALVDGAVNGVNQDRVYHRQAVDQPES